MTHYSFNLTRWYGHSLDSNPQPSAPEATALPMRPVTNTVTVFYNNAHSNTVTVFYNNHTTNT